MIKAEIVHMQENNKFNCEAYNKRIHQTGTKEVQNLIWLGGRGDHRELCKRLEFYNSTEWY